MKQEQIVSLQEDTREILLMMSEMSKGELFQVLLNLAHRSIRMMEEFSDEETHYIAAFMHLDNALKVEKTINGDLPFPEGWTYDFSSQA